MGSVKTFLNENVHRLLACLLGFFVCFGWSVLAAKKSKSLIGLVVSVDIKHHVYILPY